MSTFLRRSIRKAQRCLDEFGAALLIATVVVAALPLTIGMWPGGWGVGSDEFQVFRVRDVIGPQGNPKRDDGLVVSFQDRVLMIEIPGKSVWDFVGLIGAPLVLLFLGAQIQSSQQRRDVEAAKEDVLQRYFDRMSDLLIDKDLMTIAKSPAQKREKEKLYEASKDIIRARTLSTLRRFEEDVDRKTSLLIFLSESEMISTLRADLCDMDFSYVRISNASFEDGNFAGASFQSAELLYVEFQRADLTAAKLGKSSCIFSNFTESNLCAADLSKSNLKGALLCNADLEAANLSRANLKEADMTGARLEKADLAKISFDSETIWPAKEEVAKAKNIPSELKEKLGL